LNHRGDIVVIVVIIM